MTDPLLEQLVLELRALVKEQGKVIEALDRRLAQLETRQNPDPAQWAHFQGPQCSI